MFQRRAAAAVSVVALTGSAVWSSSSKRLHNDSLATPRPSSTKNTPNISQPATDVLQTLAWGSNRYKTLLSDPSSPDVIRSPMVVPSLDNVALRDLAIHEKHAACVDARGDIAQWGTGFADAAGTPTLTLRGKNIIQIQLSESKLFALSASGKIYVLDAKATNQKLLPGAASPSSSPWWSIGWLWGEEKPVIDFEELQPNHGLSRGEKMVSISAGENHLLALTSKGRAFAHPMNKRANFYGQLGLRKWEIRDNSDEAVAVELVPKSVIDPFAKSTPFTRTSTQVPEVNDEGIRFCSAISEIPSLKGVELEKLVAGANCSFALTKNSGRILGWGANGSGQLGLGEKITLDTITVPTEVNLWRRTPRGQTTRCLDVFAGGDLTGFLVEISSDKSKSIELQMCGNGQWGGLGNNQFSNAWSTPVRAKNVSGLTEYSDKAGCLVPIVPHQVCVSPTGHVLLALDTPLSKDLVSWGKNHDSELGNGKKVSLSMPTTLEIDGERFLLWNQKAKEIKDLSGKVCQKGVEVEQQAAAGPGKQHCLLESSL
ncbi:regulator of chromosome condensation 1/beta-lactamase-inhibitor protein II, partial [Mycena floridula]